MDPIAVPKPVPNLVEVVTEETFSSLQAHAQRVGLQLTPPMGLMYLPSQEATAKFIDGCRAVIECLRPAASASSADQ